MQLTMLATDLRRLPEDAQIMVPDRTLRVYVWQNPTFSVITRS